MEVAVPLAFFASVAVVSHVIEVAAMRRLEPPPAPPPPRERARGGRRGYVHRARERLADPTLEPEKRRRLERRVRHDDAVQRARHAGADPERGLAWDAYARARREGVAVGFAEWWARWEAVREAQAREAQVVTKTAAAWGAFLAARAHDPELAFDAWWDRRQQLAGMWRRMERARGVLEYRDAREARHRDDLRVYAALAARPAPKPEPPPRPEPPPEPAAAKVEECPVCLTNRRDRVLVPCGHVFCGPCAKRQRRCYMCQTRPSEVMRAFIW